MKCVLWGKKRKQTDARAGSCREGSFCSRKVTRGSFLFEYWSQGAGMAATEVSGREVPGRANDTYKGPEVEAALRVV
jgi:hypothetical protein